jgi:hypothetical protein
MIATDRINQMAIMKVPVTKGKSFVEFDTEKLPEAVYAEALLQGLKTLVNRGMSKVTTGNLGDEEAVKAEAMVIAQKNVEAINEGKIKFSGKAAGKSKVSGAVNTEAMRIARNRVKDALKAAGMKISYVKASDITSAAKELIASEDEASDTSCIAMAKANLDKRAEAPIAIDIKSLVHEDATLREKGEAKKAAEAANKPISAKQAGMVKGRKPKAKPSAEVAQG